MAEIRAVFTRGHLSWPIRAAQAFGPFGHVASVAQSRATIEALAFPGRVVVRDVPNLLARSTYAETLALGVSEQQAADRDGYLFEQIGKRYDYLGAVGSAWLQVRQWQSPDQWFCSELEAKADQMIGALVISEYLRGISPMQLYSLMIAAGWRRVPNQFSVSD